MSATYYSQCLRLIESCLSGLEEYENEDGRFESAFLGTCFSLTPSGKYYMPWACSNVTEAEANRDEAWNEALEEAANHFGGWIESGEGNPCDYFFVKACEVEEEESEEEDC